MGIPPVVGPDLVLFPSPEALGHTEMTLSNSLVGGAWRRG